MSPFLKRNQAFISTHHVFDGFESPATHSCPFGGISIMEVNRQMRLRSLINSSLLIQCGAQLANYLHLINLSGTKFGISGMVQRRWFYHPRAQEWPLGDPCWVLYFAMNSGS